jgi:hypothetical protein
VAILEHGPVVHGITSGSGGLSALIRGGLLVARVAEGADWRWRVFTRDLVFVARRPRPRHGVTPSILLLPALAADESVSMERYARELSPRCASSRRPAVSRWNDRPVALPVEHSGRGSGAPDRPGVVQYVTYPRSLRQRRADVFHILDQACAHLIRSLDRSGPSSPATTLFRCWPPRVPFRFAYPRR